MFQGFLKSIDGRASKVHDYLFPDGCMHIGMMWPWWPPSNKSAKNIIHAPVCLPIKQGDSLIKAHGQSKWRFKKAIPWESAPKVHASVESTIGLFGKTFSRKAKIVSSMHSTVSFPTIIWKQNNKVGLSTTCRLPSNKTMHEPKCLLLTKIGFCNSSPYPSPHHNFWPFTSVWLLWYCEIRMG